MSQANERIQPSVPLTDEEMADAMVDAARRGYPGRANDAIKAIAHFTHVRAVPLRAGLLAMQILAEENAADPEAGG